jgi:membrane-bound ClpP family serine protease
MLMMQTQSFIQAIILGGNAGTGLIILGAILLALGIILGHFFPNKYWIALIVVGIVLLVIGAILVAVGSL